MLYFYLFKMVGMAVSNTTFSLVNAISDANNALFPTILPHQSGSETFIDIMATGCRKGRFGI